MSQRKHSNMMGSLCEIQESFKLRQTGKVGYLQLVSLLCLFLPIGSFLLWLISLKSIQVRHMTDLGLISVLPAGTIIALGVLVVSFCMTLRWIQKYEALAFIHLVLLVFMLYGITMLVEEAPRFAIVYRHAGYTEYIMRTGSVNADLDAYFNWPGFFILSAFLTQVLGYHDILSFAGWTPIFLNLIYLGPLYMIFTTATKDKHLVWLGLLFFCLTNWIGQDYFSPQGLNFFFYLVIIAMLLKWFKVKLVKQPDLPKSHGMPSRSLLSLLWRCYTWITAPAVFSSDCPLSRRLGLLIVLITIFAFTVFSHPLTPFFIVASVTVLVIFRRCGPIWLPILMAVMISVWVIFMARPFLIGHISMLTGSLGRVNSSISTNVTDRVIHGSQEHICIAAMRVLMTGMVWGLAFLGGVRRYRQGYRDLVYVLLAITPFSIIIAQSYGGEIFLRIYLFSLPMMSFFAAALFCPSISQRKSLWMTMAVVCTSVALLGGFLFTRYGNERMDYMTSNEVMGVLQLYHMALPHSLLIEGWYGVPWQFQGYETYIYCSMQDILGHAVFRTVATRDIDTIVKFIKEAHRPSAYIIFTRSAKVSSSLLSGLPQGTLDRLEEVLLRSGAFRLVYRNSDAQILRYVHE